MTVAELIDALSNYDPDMKVLVSGYESGFDEPNINMETALLDTNFQDGKKKSWYMGRHDYGYNEIGSVPVLVIER